MSQSFTSVLLRRMGEYDTHLCLAFNRGVHRPLVSGFFALVSRLGDGVFWYALMSVLALTQGRPGLLAALNMVAVGLVCITVYKSLKSSCMRPRPYAVVQQIRLGAAPLDLYSFPSGHTLHAVAFSVVACAWFPQLGFILVPLTALIAASRMVLGLHYPSDVLAGAAIGAGIAAAGLRLWPLT